MAKSFSTGAGVPDKPHCHSFQTEASMITDGLVQHASAFMQDQISSIVDETGSATISDIVAELFGHPEVDDDPSA